MALTFASNGLLSQAPAELSSIASDDSLEPRLFFSNGLLSQRISTSDTPSTESAFPSLSFDVSTESLSTRELSPDDPFSSKQHDGVAAPSASSLDTLLADDETDDGEPFPRPSQLIPRITTVQAPALEERGDSRLIKCKTFDGRTLFFPRRKKSDRHTSSHPHDDSLVGLLEVPLHRLMDELAAKAVDPGTRQETDGASPAASQHRAELWVDRYRPQRFVELAGDERVNRETLAWVKEWDQCVFGSRRRKLKRKREEEPEQGGWTDQWGRPREKILLLSGPPGLGKTTLAHVVANQAGYTVLEVNASDARSGNVIEDRIRPTLEAGHAMGSTKPVLVVIDEIDGATGDNGSTGAGFINKLIGLTMDPPKKKSASGARSAKRPLLRPIICICNDLYTNSLAKLRLHARIIRVNPSPPLIVTKRLRSICEQEHLRSEGRALNLLAEICQSDLRSCLNALQFMKMKLRGQVVTEEHVRSATVGVKEAETSIQSVWSDLFTPLNKKRVKTLGLSPEDEARWVSRLVHSVESSGNMDKVALGAFEHYATLHPHETTLRRFEAANDWLSSYDILSSTSRSGQEFALQVYFAYAIVPLFHHLAASGNAKVERPNLYWECFTKAKAGEETLATLAKSILYPVGGRQHQTVSQGYRHLLGKDVLRTEFVPLLNRLISPPLRPVNKQIIKADERLVLDRLLGIMLSTGLSYQHDKTEDGQLVYRLEPAIDSFIVYEGKRAADIGVARYAVRHMIANEIEEATTSRRIDIIEKGSTAIGSQVSQTKSKKARDSSVERTVDIADKPAVDFFGRPIIKPTADTSKPSAPKSKKFRPESPTRFSVNYRYHEGNSSAVRKPISMATFL